MNVHVLAIETVRQFIVQGFCKVGVAAVDGEIVADNLINADLWGIESHGISRFPVYLKRIREGAVNPKPDIKITSTLPAVLSVDGDNGLGAVVALRALTAAMNTAGQFGLCVAGVKRSNHYGAARYYCDYAARQNYIALILTDSPPAMAPWGGKEAYLGTNPIAIGLPRCGKHPVLIDMATSLVARGKIILAAQKGEKIPEEWALDKNGMPTTNATAALAGVLLPMAGPKGYALAVAVEHLAGVMTGAAFGREVTWQYADNHPANVGHLVILIRADAFLEIEDYYKRTERFCQEIKGCEKAVGVNEIFLPGERGHLSAQVRYEKGIGVPSSLWEEFREIAKEFDLFLEEK